MSLASEYAARCKAAQEKPKGYSTGSSWVTEIDGNGYLRFNGGVVLLPEQAMALAWWIIETFSDDHKGFGRGEPDDGGSPELSYDRNGDPIG